MDLKTRLRALKARVAERPNITVKEIAQEVQELMLLGVRCRRFSDEVGLSNYTIYRIRKLAGISRPARPRKKFREVKVVTSPPAEPKVERAVAPVTFDISIKISRGNDQLGITGELSEVIALVKGIL